jgi:hypothetical protein
MSTRRGIALQVRLQQRIDSICGMRTCFGLAIFRDDNATKGFDFRGFELRHV